MSTEKGNSVPEMLEELVGHAIMATREGKMAWGESFRPNAFRSTIGPRAGDSMDLEILRDAGNGRVKAVLWNRGDLVVSFHPRAETEAYELLEHLERNTIQQDQKVRRALEQIRELRGEGGELQENTITRLEWTVRREMGARDEEDEFYEFDVRITFSEPEGTPTGWDHWEDALDYFLQYDDLNMFMEDTDYWHCRTDFLLTGTGFDFDLDGLDPEADEPTLSGEAIRYAAREGMGGSLTTLTDADSIVSRVKFRMEFENPGKVRPVLRNLRECGDG